MRFYSTQKDRRDITLMTGIILIISATLSALGLIHGFFTSTFYVATDLPSGPAFFVTPHDFDYVLTYLTFTVIVLLELQLGLTSVRYAGSMPTTHKTDLKKPKKSPTSLLSKHPSKSAKPQSTIHLPSFRKKLYVLIGLLTLCIVVFGVDIALNFPTDAPFSWLGLTAAAVTIMFIFCMLTAIKETLTLTTQKS